MVHTYFNLLVTYLPSTPPPHRLRSTESDPDKCFECCLDRQKENGVNCVLKLCSCTSTVNKKKSQKYAIRGPVEVRAHLPKKGKYA